MTSFMAWKPGKSWFPALNLAPIQGSQRIQGWRIFNFLGSLDPKSKICQILKFLSVKVAYDLIYGPKTMKIMILP